MEFGLVQGAVNSKAAENASHVQMAVAKKIMDSQRMDGQNVLKLLNAATAGPAAAGDQLVAAATGLGGSIDAYG